MVSVLDLHAGCSGFKSHSDHCLDLSWVIPESYPPRFVNSQLVCFLPVGVFNCVVCMCVSNSEKLALQLLQNPSINRVVVVVVNCTQSFYNYAL